MPDEKLRRPKHISFSCAAHRRRHVAEPLDNTNMMSKLRAAMHSINYKMFGIARCLTVAMRLSAVGLSLRAH